ncbi:hypothetical protein [Teredinibacter purpureus]|jgi:hypothetical protein|uniref:hypothetical protein n=1 Tax=Teredinibacter purpureus TaxID=2731756 RepID=UPI0005F81262|nr:hypothetical protein [Teredinibacter purpureus]
MNVTIEGYVSYTCTRCKEKYNVDGQSLIFHEDASPESEDDDYIRYITQLEAPCTSCAQHMLVTLEVWEYPESVANYSYFCGESVSAVACEFTIEHYFNDETAMKEGGHDDPRVDALSEEDTEDKVFNESTKEQGYTDQYDFED